MNRDVASVIEYGYELALESETAGEVSRLQYRGRFRGLGDRFLHEVTSVFDGKSGSAQVAFDGVRGSHRRGESPATVVVNVPRDRMMKWFLPEEIVEGGLTLDEILKLMHQGTATITGHSIETGAEGRQQVRIDSETTGPRGIRRHEQWHSLDEGGQLVRSRSFNGVNQLVSETRVLEVFKASGNGEQRFIPLRAVRTIYVDPQPDSGPSVSLIQRLEVDRNTVRLDALGNSEFVVKQSPNDVVVDQGSGSVLRGSHPRKAPGGVGEAIEKMPISTVTPDGDGPSMPKLIVLGIAAAVLVIGVGGAVLKCRIKPQHG